MADDQVSTYQEFFTKVLSDVNPNDQLPVKLATYNITQPELRGAVIDWTFQFLNSWNCPASLLIPLSKVVLDEVRIACQKDPLLYGFDENRNEFESLKLMQAVIHQVVDICTRLQNGHSFALLPSSRSNKNVSIHAIKNFRRFMEDRHIRIDDLHRLFDLQDEGRMSYYAIFDGHNGQDAAAYCSSHLHQYLVESSHYPQNPVGAFYEAFQKTDEYFLQKAERENLKSGTTAVCTLLDHIEKMLYVAWVGDSEAILVKRGQVLPLVVPHKADREDEKERIIDAGGFVLFWSMAWRVNGQLAVSRAIGNREYKRYVVSDPDIRSLPLSGEEDFLVLACDGLWDHVTPSLVAEIVYQHVEEHNGEEVEQISQKLVHAAKTNRSEDNISVIVVFLRDPKQIAAEHSYHTDIKLTVMETVTTAPALPPATGDSSTSSPAGASSVAFHAKQNGNAAAPPGYYDDDDDYGPETDVDNADESSFMLMGSAHTPPKKPKMDDKAPQEFQDEVVIASKDKEISDVTTGSEETDGINNHKQEVGSVGEPSSEEEEEDSDPEEDWKYYGGKGETTGDRKEKVEENIREPPTFVDGGESSAENMAYHLNPDAAEFVPTSPVGSRPSDSPLSDRYMQEETRQRLINDEIVSSSPMKGHERSMDNVDVPSLDDFRSEICKRPSDVMPDFEPAATGNDVEFGDQITGNDTLGTSTKAVYGDDSGVDNLLDITKETGEETHPKVNGIGDDNYGERDGSGTPTEGQKAPEGTHEFDTLAGFSGKGGFSSTVRGVDFTLHQDPYPSLFSTSLHPAEERGVEPTVTVTAEEETEVLKQAETEKLPAEDEADFLKLDSFSGSISSEGQTEQKLTDFSLNDEHLIGAQHLGELNAQQNGLFGEVEDAKEVTGVQGAWEPTQVSDEFKDFYAIKPDSTNPFAQPKEETGAQVSDSEVDNVGLAKQPKEDPKGTKGSVEDICSSFDAETPYKHECSRDAAGKTTDLVEDVSTSLDVETPYKHECSRLKRDSVEDICTSFDAEAPYKHECSRLKRDSVEDICTSFDAEAPYKHECSRLKHEQKLGSAEDVCTSFDAETPYKHECSHSEKSGSEEDVSVGFGTGRLHDEKSVEDRRASFGHKHEAEGSVEDICTSVDAEAPYVHECSRHRVAEIGQEIAQHGIKPEIKQETEIEFDRKSLEDMESQIVQPVKLQDKVLEKGAKELVIEEVKKELEKPSLDEESAAKTELLLETEDEANISTPPATPLAAEEVTASKIEEEKTLSDATMAAATVAAAAVVTGAAVAAAKVGAKKPTKKPTKTTAPVPKKTEPLKKPTTKPTVASAKPTKPAVETAKKSSASAKPVSAKPAPRAAPLSKPVPPVSTKVPPVKTMSARPKTADAVTTKTIAKSAAIPKPRPATAVAAKSPKVPNGDVAKPSTKLLTSMVKRSVTGATPTKTPISATKSPATGTPPKPPVTLATRTSLAPKPKTSTEKPATLKIPKVTQKATPDSKEVEKKPPAKKVPLTRPLKAPVGGAKTDVKTPPKKMAGSATAVAIRKPASVTNQTKSEIQNGSASDDPKLMNEK